MKKSIFYIIILISFCTKTYATHIVGGELIYDYLGNNDYRVTLKIYRDCSSQTQFDGTGGNSPSAILTIYWSNGDSSSVHNIGAPSVVTIPPTINNPCIQAPNNVCVEEGVYTYTVNLPPKTGGYYLIYQRCCRNNTILNLVTPGNQGSTYYTKIPGPEDAVVNSSPRYKIFPPIFVCANVHFTFDHAATDPDGDQLLYSLCTPFQGLDASCPSLTNPPCPTQAPPPPYANVLYSGSYTGAYPISASPAFSINPITGLLSGRPNLIGQFVVSVCIQESRGNKILNTHFRDFQFNVTPCVVNVVSLFEEPLSQCSGDSINITFVNQSFGNLGGLTYHWDFGVPGTLADTSNLLNPTYNFVDTGAYIVTLIANPGKICSDTFKRTFFVYPELKAAFPHQANQCIRYNSFNFTNTSVHQPSGIFKWDFTSNATPSVSTLKTPPTVVFNQPGKYYIKLWAKHFQCRDSVIDTIRIYERPKAKINNLPVSLCDPARVGFSNGSTSELPVGYVWKFSNGETSRSFEPLMVFSPAGVYSATLFAITNSVCVDSSMASVQNITVNPVPTAGFTLTPEITTIFDPEITFKNYSSDNVINWYYEYGDGSNSTAAESKYEYKAPGTYTVVQTVSNVFNCSDTATRVVKILPEYRFWIPNSFTPNGDGLNDIFKPSGLGWLEYDFDIYNKWGEKIFSTDANVKGWDGTFKGKLCEQDVYVWKITFTNEVTLVYETHYGHVNLLPGEK